MIWAKRVGDDNVIVLCFGMKSTNIVVEYLNNEGKIPKKW